MAVKITPSGEQLILQQIARLEQELKQVRMDKNIAFNACGDDKLANPNFHKLEQDERILMDRLNEIQQTYKTAELIEFKERNTKEVAIGSIVKCLFEYPADSEEETYEIVGYGESNIDENKIYYDAPVAQKLISLKVGEETILSLPSGKIKCRVIGLYSTWDEAAK
ncbi:GreA/GreB family elongation factor [Mesobacillus sp. AQ2]|uniref:GreA/GreB family elongation factor n=1 Tax=unclassified Mesobacillus TaxID=2675270 RepID=UPI00203F43D8|nr:MULTISPECIES: GreA/GreB family elongation factor [unclassified Mesobacillus]MCM3122018.1 GreA/GreB family elongation factor [Mesobacillus sp. MER 33]MCM3231982.1 GreA/GreB family elongation factor [Mesobacillus sp. MER 48]WHX38939.1 GreA/GreB family elongation factor [Mesobacillus sp. AQ2]